jgi:hypothetical protein
MLRTESKDYKTNYLENSIEVNALDNGYSIKAEISTNDKNINYLLEQGNLVKGLYIKSGAVWYRKFLKINSEQPLIINSKDIYGAVEIIPCIIANKKIEKFYSEDFNDEYKDINIFINKGELVAIGDEYIYDAILESDILKNTSSIFTISMNENKKIEYISEGHQIDIYLPKNIMELYNMARESSMHLTKSILNNLIVFPILLEIVHIMSDESKKEAYMEYKWYKTIDKTIQDKIDQKVLSTSNMDSPLTIAQAIVPGLIENSFIELKDIISQIGSGDSE